VATKTFAGFELLLVPEDEAWAANTLRVENTILLQHGFPKTIELVAKRYESVEILDISEFRKMEAGLSCLSIIFREAT
jgi:dimethylargininase